MADGILIIDKPAGITSHDVVARCRRILQMKSIGHTGTLDPFATGVMVILVGKATRLAQFLDKDSKEYEAVVRLGFETDTGDRTGSVKCKAQSAKSVSIDEIKAVLPEFLGEIEQTPPMYSAKKVAGKKLYELARKGIEIERKPVRITTFELQITNYESPKESDESGIWNLESGIRYQDFGLRVSCSAGTYIRTLAEDIGKNLGTGAHLAELRRTKAGRFVIDKAVTLGELEKIVFENKLDGVIISMNEAVSHLPEIKLSADEIIRTKNGIKLQAQQTAADGSVFRMTDKDENLIAVGCYQAAEKAMQPKLVLV